MNKINVGDLLVVNGVDGLFGRHGDVNDLIFIYKESINYFYYKNLTQNYEDYYFKYWFEAVLEKGHLVKL